MDAEDAETDDHRKEEQPSTSKNETNKERDDAQARRRQRDDDNDDRSREDRTETDTSGSILSSAKSRLEMRADTRPYIPKPPIGKRDKPERKKRVRRGRVSKRRRSSRRNHHHNNRKTTKRNSNEKRQRYPSVSTIFTGMSSLSELDPISCSYCGHRCCGRRLTDIQLNEIKRRQRRQLVRKIIERLRQMRQTRGNKTKGKRKNMKLKGVQKRKGIIIKLKKSNKEPRRGKVRRKGKKRCIPDDKKKVKPNKDELEEIQRNLVLNQPCSGVKGHQVGSASKMLSPLFVKTNVILQEEVPEEKQSYNEITPEMIFQTLRKLQNWKQFSNMESILTGIKCYPVNPNQEELAIELVEKLRVAAIAGIVIQAKIGNTDCWCLACDLQKRGLNKNHVTLFWQAYGDTLSGVKKNTTIVNGQNENRSSTYVDVQNEQNYNLK